MKIHPSAYIEPGAVIGEGTEIGPNVVIYRHVTLGRNCTVHAGAVLGDVPQDIAFKHVDSFVRIADHCVIREHVTIHRGTKEGTATEVGEGCFLMANSHLAHNVRLGNKVILANGVLLAGYVEVGDGAFISGNAAVHQFTRIGRLAMISGLGAISKDVPPFCTTPALQRNVVAGLNVVGLRRAGVTPAQRQEIKRAFTLVFRSGLNVTQAVKKIRDEIAGGPALEMADFIDASTRGICAASSSAGDDSEVDDQADRA